MGEEKEHLIREAINNGISSDSIYQTLSKMFGSGDLSKYSKRQVELAINNICDMKVTTASRLNPEYSSELIRNNYDKIIDALENGISPEEVVSKLIWAVKDPDISKDDFKYLVSLVANIKKNDLKYVKNEAETYQKDTGNFQKQLTN